MFSMLALYAGSLILACVAAIMDSHYDTQGSKAFVAFCIGASVASMIAMLMYPPATRPQFTEYLNSDVSQVTEFVDAYGKRHFIFNFNGQKIITDRVED